MKKTILVLSVCLAISICGCDPNIDSNDKNSKSTTASTTQSVDQTTKNVETSVVEAADNTTENVETSVTEAVDETTENVGTSVTKASVKRESKVSSKREGDNVGKIDAEYNVQGDGNIENDDMGIELDINTPEESASEEKTSRLPDNNTVSTKNNDVEENIDDYETETVSDDAPIELPFIPAS